MPLPQISEDVLELIIFGVVLIIAFIFGRAFCGRLCPVGFIQDLAHKIPFPLKIKTFKCDKYLRYIKYLRLIEYPLIVAALIFPKIKNIISKHQSSETSTDFFDSFDSIESIFGTAISVIGVLVICAIIKRPYCKYLCNEGAVLSIGNKVAFYKYKIDTEKCNQCGICIKFCKMNLIPYKDINSLECIRCNKCIQKCPGKAIK